MKVLYITTQFTLTTHLIVHDKVRSMDSSMTNSDDDDDDDDDDDECQTKSFSILAHSGAIYSLGY